MLPYQLESAKHGAAVTGLRIVVGDSVIAMLLVPLFAC